MRHIFGFWMTVMVVVGVAGCSTDSTQQVLDDGGVDVGALVDVPNDVLWDDAGDSFDATRDVATGEVGDTGVFDDGDFGDVDGPDGDVVAVDSWPDSFDDTVETDESAGDICNDPACLPCPDDGLVCTVEERDESGTCVARLLGDFCLIDIDDGLGGGVATCFFTLEPAPDNVCLVCVPSLTPEAFSSHEGMPCDDNDPCSAGDLCSADGSCIPGGPTNCDDNNECTFDECVQGVGCNHLPRQAECDDHNECTLVDSCDDGVCVGLQQRDCRDSNSCTDDLCEPDVVGGCVHEPNSLACNDLNACTQGDVCVDGVCVGEIISCNDDDPCTNDSCIPTGVGGCRNVYHYDSCVDGNACTINDFCNGAHVCGGTAINAPVYCNDNNSCTQDSCDPLGGCVYDPIAGSCDDDNPCTIDDQCSAGVCTGVENPCDDGNLCTIDTCSEIYGCKHLPNIGLCDDGDECTIGETCSTGVCEAPDDIEHIRDCNDHNVCTVDSCDTRMGCIHTPTSGPCEDPNTCSMTGVGYCEQGECVSVLRDCEDGDPCTYDTCDAEGDCIHLPQEGECDDGNHCTINETCISGVCMGGDPVDCDDVNVCTIDSCNDEYGCVFTSTTGGQCNDVNVCTINDQCLNGECVGQRIVCNDGNFCTDDLCDAADGCFHPPLDQACNDYNICTHNDWCSDHGVCGGVSNFEDPSLKAGQFSFGISGNPGQGVNVDGDELTCAPKGSCVTGIDNSLATLHWMFNPEFTHAVTEGTLALLMEPELPEIPGEQFDLNLYYGARIDPLSCDPAVPWCNYGVFQDYLVSGCEAKWVFSNAVISGTTLTAGGPDYVFPFYLVFGDNMIPLELSSVRIKATVSFAGGVVTSGSGAIGGAILRQTFISAVAGIPADQFPPPYNREIVLKYLDMFLKADLDMDDDGTAESVSIGMPFTLVAGHIIQPI